MYLTENIGSENEICGTVIGILMIQLQFNVVKEEIDEIKLISAMDLLSEN